MATLSGAARNFGRRCTTWSSSRQPGQRVRPVDGGIAAAGDDDPLAAEILPALHQVEDAFALVALDPVEGWPVGAEGTDTGGDQHRRRLDPRPGRGDDAPAAVGAGDRLDLLVQMIGGRERRGLLHQPLDQLGRVDARIAGDVVDRFLRIKCRALPARGVEGVDHMGANLQHAALEDGEKPDRTGSDDGDIGRVRAA